MAVGFFDVVALGGAAGAAIADRLAGVGESVALLYLAHRGGATENNQKWLHSGFLYPSLKLAKRVWPNFLDKWTLKSRYLVLPPELLAAKRMKPETLTAWFLCRNERTFHDKKQKWDQEPLNGVAPYDTLDEYKTLGFRFEMSCAGAFATPDCPIDFPKIFGDLRDQIAGQVETIADAEVTDLLIESNGVRGVWHVRKGSTAAEVLQRANVVVAMGHWSCDLLG